MSKSVRTFTANIALGLREGYSDRVHTLEDVKKFLQEYVDKVRMSFTVTPTTFIYTNGKEEGVIIGLINYPRFPTNKKKIRKTAEEIAFLCKQRYKQERVSIIYPDKTVMLE